MSMFNNGTIGQNRLVGGNSLLKISRDLYSTTVAGKGSGYSVNNYPNGLEITSFIPAISSTSVNANKSVAIAVGAKTIISSTSTASTTGFFVSDTGENIAVGQPINYSAAIGVSGAGTDYAIVALGNVGIAGDTYIVGDVGVTGNVNIINGAVTINQGTSDLNIFQSSATTADITIDQGRISNNSGTTYANGPGAVYRSPGDGVIEAGNFYYATANILGTTFFTGTWTKIGNVVSVCGKTVGANPTSNIYYVPVQPGGGYKIEDCLGIARRHTSDGSDRIAISTATSPATCQITGSANTVSPYTLMFNYRIIPV